MSGLAAVTDWLGAEILGPALESALDDEGVQRELSDAASAAIDKAVRGQAVQTTILTVGAVLLLAVLLLRR